MIKRISDELAIDIGRIEWMEHDGDYWCVWVDSRLRRIKHFEALRIFEILGEKVTNKERYG